MVAGNDSLDFLCFSLENMKRDDHEILSFSLTCVHSIRTQASSTEPELGREEIQGQTICLSSSILSTLTEVLLQFCLERLWKEPTQCAPKFSETHLLNKHVPDALVNMETWRVTVVNCYSVTVFLWILTEVSLGQSWSNSALTISC